jgi:hypothetical protein
MKKRWLVCGLVIVSIPAWLAGSAGSSGAAGIHDYARAASFDTAGVSIHCETNACPIPLVTPWTFTLDTVGDPYDAVLTASLTYQTSKGLKVTATPQLTHGTTHVDLPFSGRPLPPAASPKSATLTWLLSDLDANTEYGLYISVLPTGVHSYPYDISTGNVTLAVEGAPA